MAKNNSQESVNFKDERSSFQAEVNAKIPYLMGLNAKLQMKRDPFLMRFIPKITADVMKRIIPKELLASKNLRLENLYEMENPEAYFEKIMYEDTRLLSMATEASIEDYFSEWQDEIENLNKLKVGAKGALDLISSFSENLRKGGVLINAEQRAELLNDMKILDGKISEGIKKVQELSVIEKNQQSHIKQKIANRNEIRRLNAEIINFKISKNLNKARLAADGCFDFLDREKAKGTTKDTFISGFTADCRALIKQLETNYMEKYNMVPSCVKAFGEMLLDVPKLCRENNPNMVDITAKYESGIEHYVSLLEDGPVMILQITRLFPELVRKLDHTLTVFGKKLDEAMNASVVYEDEDDLFRGRNRFQFDMSNILADDGTYYTDEEANLKVLAVYGPPGIGKTAGLASLVKDIGCNSLQISMPAADLSLFAGLTALNAQSQVIQTPSANLAPAVSHPSLVIIDEATSPTDVAVAPQLARFLQLGEVAQGRKIHPLTTTVLLANDDIQHNSNVKMFDPLLMSRMYHMRRKDPNKLITDWISYVQTNKGIQNDKNTKTAYDLIISFLTMSENGRKYWVQKGKNETKDVSPNFRTWSNLADNIGKIINRMGYTVYQKAEDMKIVAEEIIGRDAAEDFASFYKLSANIPTVKTLLDRMNTQDVKLTIKDAVRLFDLTSSQVKDISKQSAMDMLNEDQQNDPEEKIVKKTKRQAVEYGEDIPRKYRLNIKPEDTQKYLKKLNEYKAHIEKSQNIKSNGPAYTEKDLLSVDELEKCYNRIWNDKNMEELKKVAIFQISSSIQSAINEEFLKAEKNKQPVEGNDLDQLICLAMTVPFRESSRGMIANIMNDLIMPDRRDILVRRGIRYIDRQGKEIVVKVNPEKVDPLVQAMNPVLSKRTNRDDDITQVDKDKLIVVDRIGEAVAVRSVIQEVSETYKNMVKDSLGKKLLTKETELAPEIEI